MTLEYTISFAGVPFLLDSARVFRLPMPAPEVEDSPNMPPNKHQPLTDLVDEINRLIDFRYLQDFAIPSPYPGRNLGAIAYQTPLGPWPGPGMRINDFYYPVGASRWSVFRGLATSSMAKEMLRLTQGYKTQTFIMKANPISPDNPNNLASDYTISTSMYMLPPRPLAEHGGKFDGLYLITLVDERYYFQGTPVTLSPNQAAATTWANLISTIGTALGITINTPTISAVYGTPEVDSQLWAQTENAPALLDAVAANIGKSVIRNLGGTYDLFTPAQSLAVVQTNRGNANQVVRTAGGDIFNSGTQKLPIGELNLSRNAVLPTTVNVAFEKYVDGNDPVPHFLNARYPNQRPSCWFEECPGGFFNVAVPLTSGGVYFSGLSGVSQTYVHSTAKALYATEAASTGNPSNLSGLTAMAMQVAQDHWNFRSMASLDEVYPGTFLWTPEGLHDIIWTISIRGRQATTRVLRGQWNQEYTEFQHSHVALSGSTNIPPGVGGPAVPQTWRDTALPRAITTTLNGAMTATQNSGRFAGINYFPTQNRWKGQIDNEKILFEGTSGGSILGVVYRGIDGTIAASHANAATVTYLSPDVTYGVNLVTYEKGQFVFPHAWTSGGIQEVRVVPQIQNVRLLEATGNSINSISHYSGQVQTYDTTSSSGSQFSGQEYCWVVERNNNANLLSGQFYEGHLVGFGAGGDAPVYAVNAGQGWAIGTASGDLTGTYPSPTLATAFDSTIAAPCEGRLTLVSGDAASATSTTNTDTIYFTPYMGNRVALYNGYSDNRWRLYALTETALSPPSAILTTFDIFAYDSSGTIALETTNWTHLSAALTNATNATPIVITSTAHGLVTNDLVYITGVLGNTAANGYWVVTKVDNDTFSLNSSAGSGAYTSGGTWYQMNGTRATALTTQNGVLVRSGSNGLRRYLGTGMTTETSAKITDSFSRRFLWNYYNRLQRTLIVQDTTNTWTYTTATWRPARGPSANNFADLVIGVQETPVQIAQYITASNDTATGFVAVGIGVNSTTAINTGIIGGLNLNVVGQAIGGSAHTQIGGFTSIGYKWLWWLENSINTTGTTTWYGDNGGVCQSGFQALVWA